MKGWLKIFGGKGVQADWLPDPIRGGPASDATPEELQHVDGQVTGAAAWADLDDEEVSVEQYAEVFRRAPIGVWRGWKEDPAVGGERLIFNADQTGFTDVFGPGGVQEDRCIFEWQELGERCIRMRYIAWLASDEGTEAEEWSEESDEPAEEAELVEPEQGEWETVEYDFRIAEDGDEAEIVMCRTGEEGFPCSCRYDEGPLVFDWAAIEEYRNARLLRAADKDDPEMLVRPATEPPNQSPDELLRPEGDP